MFIFIIFFSIEFICILLYVYAFNKSFYANYRDDTMLVSGTEDGELCLWNMDSYNLQATIKGKYSSWLFLSFYTFLILYLIQYTHYHRNLKMKESYYLKLLNIIILTYSMSCGSLNFSGRK